MAQMGINLGIENFSKKKFMVTKPTKLYCKWDFCEMTSPKWKLIVNLTIFVSKIGHLEQKLRIYELNLEWFGRS